MGEALAALHRRCDRVRFLGSYPRAGNGDGRAARPPRSRWAPPTPRCSRLPRSGWPRSGPGPWRDRPTRLMLVRHGQTDANVRPRAGLAPARRPAQRPRPRPGRGAGRPAGRRAGDRGVRLAGDPGPADRGPGRAWRTTCRSPWSTACRRCSAGTWRAARDLAAREQFDLVYAAWWRGDLDAHLPGGESAHELRDRYRAGAAADHRRRRPGPWCWSATARPSGWPPRRCSVTPRRPRTCPTPGVVILGVDGAGWVLEHWDSAPPVVGDVTAGGAPG